MTNKRVTAIIATYNRGYIVSEAIDSVLQQTYSNIEVVVVDDGSTDDTQSRLLRYGDRIRVVTQPNAGPAAAWNAGIRAASGEIICFLGSDDLYLPNFVERHVTALAKAGPAVPCSISNAIARFADGHETHSFDVARLKPRLDEGLWMNALDVLLTRFVMCGQMLAVRREVFHRIGLFDESLRFLEDYDIAYRLSLEGPWAFIEEPLVVYRQSARDSLSLTVSNRDPKLHAVILAIRNRVKQQLAASGSIRRSPYLLPAIADAKRNLHFKTLMQRSSGAPKSVLAVCDSIARLTVAVLEHSWLYPRMKVVPFASYTF